MSADEQRTGRRKAAATQHSAPPALSLPRRDAGDADDLEQLIGDNIDLLIHLLGQRAYERIDPMDPRHEKFFEWLAREARRRQSPQERQETERAARAFADRMVRRVVAERARRGTHPPRIEEPAVTTAASDENTIGEIASPPPPDPHRRH